MAILLAESNVPKRVLGTLLMTVFLDFLGFTMALPYLFFFAENLGATVLAYGIIVGSYGLMQAIFAPLFGMLSDRYGRRRILVLVLLGSSASYAIFGLSSLLWTLLISRMLIGAFSSTYSVVQAFVTDVTDKESRLKYMGYLSGAYGLGYILGPAIGGTLSTFYGFAVPAFLACFLAIINTILSYVVLPDSPRLTTPAQNGWSFSFSSLGKAFQSKEQSLLIVLNFVTTLMFVFLLVIVPPWLKAVFEFGPLETGIILAFGGMVSVISVAFAIPKLSKHLSASSLVLIGLVVVSFDYLGLGTIHQSTSTTFLLVLGIAGSAAFGFSLIGPALNTLMSISSSSKEVGSTLGIAKSSSSLAQIFAPSLATAFFAFGSSIGMLGLSFLVGALVSVAALPLILLLRKPTYMGTWEEIIRHRHSPYNR